MNIKYQNKVRLAKYIKEHRILMLKTVLTTAVQMLAYYTVPYWIYLAFGLNNSNIFDILTLQAVLYATVSGIPSPGSVGVSEGGFLGIFRNAFPETVISSAMLLSRGANFYLLILISAIVVVISTFRGRKEENVAEENKDERAQRQQQIAHHKVLQIQHAGARPQRLELGEHIEP